MCISYFVFSVFVLYWLLFLVHHVCSCILLQAAKESEAGPKDGDDIEEDGELKPVSKPLQCSRINEQFVIRKIERDRHSGRQFAPVCDEVKLSSSGSSSEDEDDKKIPCAGVPKSISMSSDELLDNLSGPMLAGLEQAAVIKSMEQKRKSPSSQEDEEIIPTKRQRRLISSSSSSSDSEIEDGSSQLEKSPTVPKKDSSSELEHRSSHGEKSPSPILKESSDSELEDRSNQVERSLTLSKEGSDSYESNTAEKSLTPIANEDNDVDDQKSTTSPVLSGTPIPGMKPSTNLPSTENIQSQEKVADKPEDKLGPEAESGREEINAETGEICYREPTDNGK